MIAQNRGLTRRHEYGAPSTLQPAGDLVESGKEWLDEFEKFFALGRQRERPAMKQRHAEKFFQLRHLSAYRRLLDAVRNMAHRLRDAFMPRDIIEQFKVMNIHSEKLMSIIKFMK